MKVSKKTQKKLREHQVSHAESWLSMFWNHYHLNIEAVACAGNVLFENYQGLRISIYDEERGFTTITDIPVERIDDIVRENRRAFLPKDQFRGIYEKTTTPLFT